MDEIVGPDRMGCAVGSYCPEIELDSQNGLFCARHSRIAERVIAMLEAERGKIAREMHDEAGQLLISAAFRVDQALALLPNSSVARDLLEQARRSLEESAEAIHRLSFNLRPRMLDDLGLLPALRSYIDRHANLTDMSVDVHLQQAPPHSLSRAVELAIFRIVQESIANICKHSQATRVRIMLAFTRYDAELEIFDDGVGFDPNSVGAEHGESSRPKLGLDGMVERAVAVGGDLQIDSAPHRGTIVRARFPINGKQNHS